MDEKRLIRLSLLFPLLFTILPWFVFVIEFSINTHFTWLGIYPRTLHGLWGIIMSPLIHGDIYHLLGNTPPLFIGLAMLIYYYKQISWEVFGVLYLVIGIWVWIMARPSYHIGASGIIYGLMSFLFFSGLIRKNKNLMAVTLTVTVIYGGMIWGALPIVKDHISWESHLMGIFAGLFVSLYYRKKGPKDDSFYIDPPLNDIWEYQNNTNPYLMFYEYVEEKKDEHSSNKDEAPKL